MRYCPKCKNLNDDTALRCSQCGSAAVRVVKPDDFILLVTATEYESEQIVKALEQAKIPCKKQPAGVDGIPSMYNSDALYQRPKRIGAVPCAGRSRKNRTGNPKTDGGTAGRNAQSPGNPGRGNDTGFPAAAVFYVGSSRAAFLSFW